MKEMGCTPRPREPRCNRICIRNQQHHNRAETTQIQTPTAKEGEEGNAPPPDLVVFDDGDWRSVRRVLHRKTRGDAGFPRVLVGGATGGAS